MRSHISVAATVRTTVRKCVRACVYVHTYVHAVPIRPSIVRTYIHAMTERTYVRTSKRASASRHTSHASPQRGNQRSHDPIRINDRIVKRSDDIRTYVRTRPYVILTRCHAVIMCCHVRYVRNLIRANVHTDVPTYVMMELLLVHEVVYELQSYGLWTQKQNSDDK